MIHEHEALELASAAMDFSLSPAEADRLSDAIAECPVCAERASIYRRHAYVLAELPALEAPDATRRRVLRAAVTGQAFDARAPMVLLAAALLLGALLAMVAFAGAAFNGRTLGVVPPLDMAVASASPPVALVSPDPSVVASPSVVPGSGGATALLPDSIADVVANNVRIRSEPRIATDSFKYKPLLKSGDRLFVLGGPTLADDYDWYEVAAWRPGTPSVNWPIGWVARGDHDGTPWVQAAASSCPTPPSIDAVVALDPHEALSCYGHQLISLRALISGGAPGDGCEADGLVRRCIVGPSWLARMSGRSASATASPVNAALALAIDPKGSVHLADLPTGRARLIEGSFDHPDAAGCLFDGYPSGSPTITQDDAVLRCRLRFVVSGTTADPNFLLAGKAAETTTDGLRVRTKPFVDATSQKLEPVLERGTRLFVLQGPVAGSGYEWYQVIAPAVSRTGGGPMIGWVAVADKTGENWVKPSSLACPAATQFVGLADLQRLATGSSPDGGLSCFGGQTITTQATMHVDCSKADMPRVGTWLSDPTSASVLLSEGGATFTGRLPLNSLSGVCDSPQDVRWNIEGHFDDPDASSCGTGSAASPAAILATYGCRKTFVVTMTLR